MLLGDYEGIMREAIGRTLEPAKDGVLDMILKDIHTCGNQPERIYAWVRVASEVAAG